MNKSMEENTDKLFVRGIELRDNGKLVEAAEVFLNIIQGYPNDSKLAGTYTVLGGVYMDLEDYENSSLYLKTATELNPKSELASLCLYLSYVKLDKSNQAIDELKRYLGVYPAKLYKDTLNELLEDLKNGYATSYKDTIFFFAKKNGVIV